MSDLEGTILGVILCSGIGAFCFWRHFRKRETLKAAPIIPWIIPGLGAAATGFMLMVHLVNLMGFETGGRF